MTASTNPVNDLSLAPQPLFDSGCTGACVGAAALIILLAFEALAVAVAMPAVASALDSLPRYALAFGGPLAASVPGMVMASRCSDRHGPLRATVGGHAEQVADLQARARPNLPWATAAAQASGLLQGDLREAQAPRIDASRPLRQPDRPTAGLRAGRGDRTMFTGLLCRAPADMASCRSTEKRARAVPCQRRPQFRQRVASGTPPDRNPAGSQPRRHPDWGGACWACP